MVQKIIHNKPTGIQKATALFLDRDGVINRCPKAHEYVHSWQELVVNQDIIHLIRELNDLGFLVIIVTNQRGISLGKMTNQAFTKISNQLFKYLSNRKAGINATYYCPHNYNQCVCRKPQAGLIYQAIKDFNIDSQKSILIGDSDSDIEAAKLAKIGSIIKIKKNNPPRSLLSSEIN
jgi:D-glycero-D-manno-heptose 1,7-bisphosphate phosphatase